MQSFSLCVLLAGVLLCVAVLRIDATFFNLDGLAGISSRGKPLLKRPPYTAYKTVLSLDGGGVRGFISALVLIELEQSIKRYILSKPYLLPYDAEIASVDDFDINLVDYFDCMTGTSAGSWSALYLASRGGQGASRAVLDDPFIKDKYGEIATGSAEGLRVFFKEYMRVVYPPEKIDLSAGTPLDLTNPNAPGVLSPLYSLDGLESALRAFLGNATLADLDTSVLVPTLDLITARMVYFVQNTFNDKAQSSSAVLLPRTKAPSSFDTAGSESNFVFSESKDYYLADAGTAATAVPVLFPSKPVSQVGGTQVEFNLIDGGIPVETTTLPALLFTATESGYDDIEKIALLSIGAGFTERDLTKFMNAGALKWLENVELFRVASFGGQEALTTLIDYLYYSNPDVKPFQFLRVQTSAPEATEEGMAFFAVDQVELVKLLETIGLRVAEEYRDSLDIFVRDFIFG